MNGVEAVVHEYALPLRHGFRLGYAGLQTRAGLILAIGAPDSDIVGIGEAAPAWWVGDESLAIAHSALNAAAQWLRQHAATASTLHDLDDAASDGRRYPEALERALEHSTAARSALQAAVLDLRARQAGQSLSEALGATPHTCTVNALIVDEDRTTLAAEIRRLLARGYTTAKIKVGGRTVEDEIARIDLAVGACAGRIRLRLDANRAWSFEHAVAVLAALDPVTVEYVEEPLAQADAETFARLHAHSPVALALDESLRTTHDIQRFAGSYDVAVLKANRVGGPHALVRMAAEASASGAEITITDSLETCIGRSLALHLAAAADVYSRPVGLAGAALLARDLCDDDEFARGPSSTPSGPGTLPLELIAASELPGWRPPREARP